jgi:hypothetical protein
MLNIWPGHSSEETAMPDNVINLDARRDALSECEATDLLRLVLSNARAGCEDGELPEEDRTALLSCLLGLASRYPAGEYTVTYRSTQDAPEPAEVLRAVLDLALAAASARVLSHDDRTGFINAVFKCISPGWRVKQAPHDGRLGDR